MSVIEREKRQYESDIRSLLYITRNYVSQLLKEGNKSFNESNYSLASNKQKNAEEKLNLVVLIAQRINFDITGLQQAIKELKDNINTKTGGTP